MTDLDLCECGHTWADHQILQTLTGEPSGVCQFALSDNETGCGCAEFDEASA